MIAHFQFSFDPIVDDFIPRQFRFGSPYASFPRSLRHREFCRNRIRVLELPHESKIPSLLYLQDVISRSLGRSFHLQSDYNSGNSIDYFISVVFFSFLPISRSLDFHSGPVNSSFICSSCFTYIYRVA